MLDRTCGPRPRTVPVRSQAAYSFQALQENGEACEVCSGGFVAQGGSPLLLLGDGRGVLHSYDLQSFAPATAPAQHHRGALRCMLAVAGPAGSAVVFSGGEDGRVCFLRRG